MFLLLLCLDSILRDLCHHTKDGDGLFNVGNDVLRMVWLARLLFVVSGKQLCLVWLARLLCAVCGKEMCMVWLARLLCVRLLGMPRTGRGDKGTGECAKVSDELKRSSP